MSAPTTLTKVYNALVRGLPSFFAGKLLLEAMSFAVALARANDYVDATLDELFGDTASSSITRWEGVHRVPSRPNDVLQVRRDRVLAVLQRVNGPQPAKLEAMLKNLLDCTEDELVLIEQMRANIEAGLTLTTGAIVQAIPTGGVVLDGPGINIMLGAPFPGVIDDMGVSIYIAGSGFSFPHFRLIHPDGTTWDVSQFYNSGFHQNRTTFLGKPAAGMWTLYMYDLGGAAILNEARLLVSNDQDSAQIYYYYAVRDAALGGTPDIDEAQRQFSRHALGHMSTSVAERTALVCDEEHCLVDREPMGVS